MNDSEAACCGAEALGLRLWYDWLCATGKQTDDGVDAEKSLSFFLSLFMSISRLRLFSRAHYWVNKYIR